MSHKTLHKSTSYSLDDIVSLYEGPFKIHRLMSIANSVPDSDSSLRAAIQSIQSDTWNVKLYEQLIERLNSVTDQEWIEYAWSQSSEQLAVSNQEISELGSKFHIEPTTARDVYIKQARIYLKMGEYLEARKTLNRIQDYSNDSNYVNQAALVVDNTLISMLLGQWPHARTIIGKELGKNSTHDIPVRSYLFPDGHFYLNIIHGLCLLTLGDYEESVSAFLERSPSEWSNHLATRNDIAFFITIIALATFPRADLQYLIDKDPVFAAYLEHDEQMKQVLTKLIGDFLDMNDKEFFECLSICGINFKTDFFLGAHYEILHEIILERSVLQYLSVFDTIPLDTYNSHFGVTDKDIDERLIQIIQKKQLPFRIDESRRMIHRIEQFNAGKLVKETENLIKSFIPNSMLTLSETQNLYEDQVKTDS